MDQIVFFTCAVFNVFLILSAFRQNMFFVFAMASFAFIYFMLRPFLVYFEFYVRYRALYPKFLSIPDTYWNVAAFLAIVNILFLSYLYLRFGSKERLMWATLDQIPEKASDRLAFWVTCTASLITLGEAAYYICLTYLLAYKTRALTKMFAAVVVIVFIISTEDRRHFVALLIFILFASIRASKDRFTKGAISSTLRRVMNLGLAVIGMMIIGAISIYYRNPENLMEFRNWHRAAAIVEIQLDFAHIYDELHNLTSALFDGGENFIHFGLMFTRIFFFWIPRTIWPEKPETIAREYAEAFNPVFYNNNGALPVGLIGDSIFSFGFLFFVGLALAVELFRLFVRLRGNSCFGLIMLTVLAFFFIRGPFDAAFFILASGILFNMLLQFFSKIDAKPSPIRVHR